MSGIPELTELFHSINGTNIKEKYKNFNNFLDLLKSNLTEEENLNNFITSITPKTHIEKLFRIDIMLQSKNTELLVEELKTCNEIIIKKLLKRWQTFEEVFLSITPADLVNNILPNLSYSLKVKILNGIRKNVKNEELLDGYFYAIEKKYGLKLATLILPGCSINLIRSKVEKFHLRLLQPHLKGIFKKDREFVEFYFDVLKRKYEDVDFTTEYLNTLKYIAKVDSFTYWKLHDKYKLKVKFGKYMTPDMVKSDKNILEQKWTVFDTFHYLKLFKTTKKEGILNSFLLNLYPETHYKFKDDFLTDNVLKFLRKGPVSQQYHLISLFFSEKYKTNLLEYPHYFTEDLLKITPIKERESVLDLKVITNEELYYLYGTQISLPRFKKQLQCSSDSKTRSKYGSLLYKTCLVNKDEVALLDVLRFLLGRYKNDLDLLIEFSSNLMDWPNIENLSEEHWKYMANINKKVEKVRAQRYNSNNFLDSYISHLIKNNKPINDIVHNKIQDILEHNHFYFLNVSDLKYQKKYCDEIAKCVDTYKDHKNYNTLCNRFLNFVKDHNKSKKVNVYDYERFFHEIDENEWSAYIIEGVIKYDNNKIHEKFWHLNRSSGSHAILWYAKYRPELVRKNVQKLSTLVNEYEMETFLKKYKKYYDPDIIEEIKVNVLNNVQNENYAKAKFWVHALSVLAPNIFLELIIPLLPALDGKIDLGDSVTEQINLQKEIAKSLSNIQDVSKSFPHILRYCVGDYLKFGLQPLYKIAYNMPEFQIKNCLSQLSKTPISVRKHLLLLSKDVFSSDDFYQLLRNWSQRETNSSVRNILLKKSIENFIENPSESIWVLLNSNLQSMDAEDREIYDFLLKFQDIPWHYLPKYLEILYETFSKNSDLKIDEKKFELIKRIPTGIIKELGEELLKQIIRDTACSEQETNFYWKCVFHVNEDRQSELFEENFAVLKTFVQTNSSSFKQDTHVRSIISTFLSHFIDLAVQLRYNLDFIQKFISMWTSIFHSEDFVKDFMLVRFVELYFKSEFDAYQTGLKINELLYDYIAKYNSTVIDTFCIQVSNFLKITSITENEERLLKFVEGLFHEKKDEHIYIAMTYFLPNTPPKIDNMYENYIPIIRAMEDCGSAIVLCHLNDYLTTNG